MQNLPLWFLVQLVSRELLQCSLTIMPLLRQWSQCKTRDDADSASISSAHYFASRRLSLPNIFSSTNPCVVLEKFPTKWRGFVTSQRRRAIWSGVPSLKKPKQFGMALLMMYCFVNCCFLRWRHWWRSLTASVFSYVFFFQCGSCSIWVSVFSKCIGRDSARFIRDFSDVTIGHCAVAGDVPFSSFLYVQGVTHRPTGSVVGACALSLFVHNRVLEC